ncbi:MAG: YkvA family protein [Calditrichota bacterium]
MGKLWDESGFGGGKSFAVVASNLEQQFTASLRKITANDIAYVIGTRGDRCIRWFQKTTPPWAQALAPQLRLLLAMLRDAMAGRFKMSWKNMAAVTSTLLYIGNPLDALPNSLPDVGYLDDALIVALCAATVRKDLRRYAAAGGVNLSEIGW